MVNLVCGILSLTCGQDGNEATGLWSGWERNAAKNIRVPKVSIIPHFCGLRSRRFRNVYFGRVKNDARERKGRGKEGFLFYSTPPLFIFRMSKTHIMERPAPAQATTWVIIPRDVTTAILVKWRLLFRKLNSDLLQIFPFVLLTNRYDHSPGWGGIGGIGMSALGEQTLRLHIHLPVGSTDFTFIVTAVSPGEHGTGSKGGHNDTHTTWPLAPLHSHQALQDSSANFTPGLYTFP